MEYANSGKKKQQPEQIPIQKRPSEQNDFELILKTKLSSNDIRVMDELEKKYPETVDAFREYLMDEYVMFCKKQYDYGPGNISVGTQLKTDKEILISLKGLWFRISDKVNRLFNIIMIKDMRSFVFVWMKVLMMKTLLILLSS